MTEQLAFVYALCAVGLLIESIATQGKVKIWLFCVGIFLLTQALNARPAAYMTLPFLVLASWELCRDRLKARGKMIGLSALAVTTSLLLHSITYHWVVAYPSPSNGWFSVYGVLTGGTWMDGRNRAEQLLKEKRGSAPSDGREPLERVYAQALSMLKDDCLAEIRRHPGKLLGGWWRGLRFFWSKNTPFRAAYPQMPSVWFTETVRWCSVLGVALSLFLLLTARPLTAKLKRYQTLSWLNLAALLGMITSLPFAPPWDAETRIFAATLPLFFLLPASGIGIFYQLLVNQFHEVPFELKMDAHLKVAISTAATIGATLSIIVIAAAWYFVGAGSTSKQRGHPFALMLDQFRAGGPSVGSFDLRPLKAGYRLHVTDDTQATWLPNISRKDFIRSVPRGTYAPLAQTFKQLPPGTEILLLPYWALLVLDKEDVRTQTFTPLPEQTGHVVSPPVYFSKRLPIESP